MLLGGREYTMKKILLSGIITALILFMAIPALAYDNTLYTILYNNTNDKLLAMHVEGLENVDNSGTAIAFPGSLDNIKWELTAWWLSYTTYRFSVDIWAVDADAWDDESVPDHDDIPWEKVAELELICVNTFDLWPVFTEIYIKKMNVISGSFEAYTETYDDGINAKLRVIAE